MKLKIFITISLVVLIYFSYVSSKQNLLNLRTPNSITQQPQSSSSSAQLYPVIKVVDGDTIDVQIDGKKESVRLIGIDSPEIVDPRRPVQCFAKEASDKAKEVLTGQTVRLEQDPTQGNRDKYDRLLRYVFLSDGSNFNKLMVEQGYAHEYTYQSNPYKYQKEFRTAEAYAREHNLGLWNKSICP